MADGKSIVVFGQKGYGKTTWIHWHMYENPDERFIIYDHFHEYFDGEIYNSLDEFFDFEVFESKKVKRTVIFRGEIDYDKFFALCIEIGHCTAVFDEIDMCCSSMKIGYNLNRIVQYGRHLDVGVIGASRRPATVNRNLTSQADKIICFHLQEPRDIKYIEEFTSPELADKLSTLPIGHYVEYPDRESQFQSNIEAEKRLTG